MHAIVELVLTIACFFIEGYASMNEKSIDLVIFKSGKIADESVKWFYSFLNIGLLVVHLFLQFLYWDYHVKEMFVINIFSLLLYVLFYFAIKKKKYKLYVMMVYLEVLAHSSIATTIIGWPAGFQLWLIALTCAYFFQTLVYEDVFSPEKLSWILTAVNIFVFFGLLLDSRFGTLPFVRNIYSGDDYFVFHVFNCIVTFFVVILFSSMFVKGIITKNNELNKEAVVDKVTGLFNRLGLIRFIENSGFKESDDFTVAIMDIDNFKSINDTYGHAAGDAALKFVGAKLNDMISNHTLACRWGGDEFLFIELGENHSETLYNTLQKLREEISNSTIVVGDTMFSIKVSAGIASFEEGDTMDKVFYKADKALYESKASGKDRVTKEG